MAAPTGLGFAERNNQGRSMSWMMFGYYNSTSVTSKLKLRLDDFNSSNTY
jgi:hypothetical protein